MRSELRSDPRTRAPRRRLFTGRAVGKPRSRAFMLVLGAIGLASAVGMLYVGFNAANEIPGRSYYYLNAEFENADLITRTAQVRVGAELVGQVSAAEVVDGVAVVELQLAADEGPLLSDTRLEVRPRSPIGVRYVDLIPGTKGKPLEDGATIPIEQTSATVPLDEALEAFDAKTRPQAQNVLRELGNGFAERGEDANVTIGASPEFLADSEAVVGAINELDGAAARFIGASEGAAAAADPVREQIAEGFAPEAEALEPFSDEGESVQATLDEAPSTLATAQSRLPQVRPLVSEVGALARSAQPTLEVAPAALDETSALLDESQPGLRDLDTTLKLLDEATDPTLELLDSVRPVLPLTDDALADSMPIVEELAPRGCDYDRLFTNWESMLGYETPQHGVLRLELMGTGESVEGGIPGPATPIYDNPYPAPCAVTEDRLR